MDYKLVCIDMDGTLLNSRHKVTESTREILKKVHDKGVHIVISTGRMYTDAEYYSNLIGVKSPVIASNGAFIKEKHKTEFIHKSVLDEKLCLEILKLSNKYKLSPMLCTPTKLYCSNLSLLSFFIYGKLRNIMSRDIEMEFVVSKSGWNRVLQKEKNNIVKCEFINRNEDKIKKLRSELKSIKDIEIVSSSKHNIEITRKGISKGKAVEVLAQHLNLKRDEVITIGDSENDLSMIEYAGLGIAMGNAIEKVKQKANFITDNNDNEGVAKALKKFILKSS
jgi:Cof subfamily protein (haloacid dehalogenase superfamily)